LQKRLAEKATSPAEDLTQQILKLREQLQKQEAETISYKNKCLHQEEQMRELRSMNQVLQKQNHEFLLRKHSQVFEAPRHSEHTPRDPLGLLHFEYKSTPGRGNIFDSRQNLASARNERQSPARQQHQHSPPGQHG
jgi:hypothetical protein